MGGIDIRVATPNARFGVMEPKRGLFAGGGTTVRLPQQVGFAAAMEFSCTRLISGDDRQIALAKAEGIRTVDIRAGHAKR